MPFLFCLCESFCVIHCDLERAEFLGSTYCVFIGPATLFCRYQSRGPQMSIDVELAAAEGGDDSAAAREGRGGAVCGARAGLGGATTTFRLVHRFRERLTVVSCEHLENCIVAVHCRVFLR